MAVTKSLQEGSYTIEITSPTEGQVFKEGDTVSLEAQVRQITPPSDPSPGTVDFTGGTTAELQAYIDDNRIVRLGAGTYRLSQPLNIPSSTTIQGIAGLTVLEVEEGVLGAISIGLETDIVVDGIDFKGASGTIGYLSNEADIKVKTGMGTTIGIDIKRTNGRNHINNCRFYDFDRSGIELRGSSGDFTQGVKITNCFFNNCYHGLWARAGGEYCNYSNLSANGCQIGIAIDAANSLLSQIHADDNRVGMLVSGWDAADNQPVTNDSHAGLSISTFNHNSLASIACFDITRGFIFSGCNVHAGEVYIENSKGFSFTGGILGDKATIVDGDGTKAGMHMFHSNFYNPGSDPITNNGTISQVSRKNNLFLDGSDSTSIND